jgi:hypothetical protein
MASQHPRGWSTHKRGASSQSKLRGFLDGICRALFTTYATLRSDARDEKVSRAQSLFRNVVSGDGFLNIYIFGIDPDIEREASSFSAARGRFLRRDDRAVAVLDQASARALGVDLGGAFPVRKADGEDLQLTVVGDPRQIRFAGSPAQVRALCDARL